MTKGLRTQQQLQAIKTAYLVGSSIMYITKFWRNFYEKK